MKWDRRNYCQNNMAQPSFSNLRTLVNYLFIILNDILASIPTAWENFNWISHPDTVHTCISLIHNSSNWIQTFSLWIIYWFLFRTIHSHAGYSHAFQRQMLFSSSLFFCIDYMECVFCLHVLWIVCINRDQCSKLPSEFFDFHCLLTIVVKLWYIKHVEDDSGQSHINVIGFTSGHAAWLSPFFKLQ